MIGLKRFIRIYRKLRKFKQGIKSKKSVFTGPLFVQIGPCDVCNYRCIMCYPHSDSFKGKTAYAENWGEFKDRGMMGFGAFERLIKEFREMNVERVHLCGIGEPFLHPDILKMVACVKIAGLWCGLTTNGSLLDQKKIEDLVDFGLDSLHISINAGYEDTYKQIIMLTSAASLENLKHKILELKDIKNKNKRSIPHLSIGFVLFNKNYLEIQSMVEFAMQVNADAIIFKHANLEKETLHLALEKEQYRHIMQTLIRIKKKIKKPLIHYEELRIIRDRYLDMPRTYKIIRCYIGWFFSRVLANGDVVSCCSENRVLGNINKNNFKEIWYSQNYNSFRQESCLLGKEIETVSGCNCLQCGNILHNVKLNKILRFVWV